MGTKKLGEKFDAVFGGPRIPLDSKELLYNNKVLVGQWFEESRNYVKHDFPRETFYQTEYVKYPKNREAEEETQNIVFDGRIRNLGEPALLADYDYATNFASLYDLMYNRAVPELLAYGTGNVKSGSRVIKPERDFVLNHVGGVNKGLLDEKRSKWASDLNVNEDLFLTTTQKHFPAPELSNYVKRQEVKCGKHAKELPPSTRVPRKIVPGL